MFLRFKIQADILTASKTRFCGLSLSGKASINNIWVLLIIYWRKPLMLISPINAKGKISEKIR